MNRPLSALKACFQSTIPVLAGYVFLGITYGILMVTNGFPFWLPILTAALVYTGSMEFLLTAILLSSFNPVSAFVTAFMVGARHLFYGLSMLGKYQNTGWKKFYLIYTTSDETFAINYAAEVPKGVDRSWYYFFVSLLDQCYWIFGAALGGIFGSLLTFNTEGLDFVMTAMFTVIFLNQWMKDSGSGLGSLRSHVSEFIGIAASVGSLFVFGPDNFIIPAMILILLLLSLFQKKLTAWNEEPAAAPGEERS